MLKSNPTLAISDLCIGDIIFFLDYSKQGTHVGVYAGEKNGVPFITHGVSKPYDSLMTTRLKADTYPYRVLRCKDFNLAAQATLRMNSWVKTGLPFSYDKSDTLLMRLLDDLAMAHPKTGGAVQADFAEQEFDKTFYRYIEMAAHPRFPFMVNDQQNEGVRCSEAVVMAFNIETLLMVDAVHSCKTLGFSWVSDKTTMTEQELTTYYKPTQSYLDYAKRRNDVNEYQPYGAIPENGIKDGYYAPSIAAWNYAKYPSIDNFKSYYPFKLPLDSKVTTSHGLMTYMLNQPDLWHDLGTLTIEDKPYALESLEADKQAWKEYVVRLFDTRNETLKEFTSRTRSLSTPLEHSSNNPLIMFSAPDATKTRKRASSLSSLSELHEDLLQVNVIDEAQKTLDKRVSVHASPKKTIQSKTALKPGVLEQDTDKGKNGTRRKLFQ